MFAEHRKECREERCGEAGKEDCLDLDDRVGRASPLWEGRRIIPERGVVDLVDEDPEEGGGLIIRIWLEVGMYFNDECRGDGGEQTSL